MLKEEECSVLNIMLSLVDTFRNMKELVTKLPYWQSGV